MTVNDLTTNLHLNLIEEDVTQTAQTITRPLNAASTTDRCRASVGQSDLYIGLPDQICVAVHHRHHTLAIGRRAGKVDTHRLNGEIGMPFVKDLPKSDVRIAGDIGILCAICDELKKTATHSIYLR